MHRNRLKELFSSTSAHPLRWVGFGIVIAGLAMSLPLEAQVKPPRMRKGVATPPQNDKWGSFKHVWRSDFLARDAKGTLTMWFPCPVKSQCGDRDSVRITIAPEEQSNLKDWASGLAGEGHIIGVVVNNDDVPFGPWNLEPKDRVYLWVGQNGDQKSFPTLYRISRVNPFDTPDVVFKFADWTSCENEKGNPPEVHPRPYGSCRRPDGPIRPEGGLWISCSAGCCHIRAPYRSPAMPVQGRP